MDRRALLDRAGKGILGSFLINDYKKILLPNQELYIPEAEPQDIILATENLPEPLGSITYEWAQVIVNKRPDTFGGFSPIGTPTEELATVVVRGYTSVNHVQRSEVFFAQAASGGKLRIYFAKG